MDIAEILESKPKLAAVSLVYQRKEGECSLDLTYQAVRAKGSKKPLLVVKDARINGDRNKVVPSEIVEMVTGETGNAATAGEGK